MRLAVPCCLVFILFQTVFGEVSSNINDDGFVVISADPAIAVAGFDIQSFGGFLLPIAPGDLTASAAPFTFLLANNEKQVTFGNLGSKVTIDGDWVTGVGYDEDGDAASDLTIAFDQPPFSCGALTTVIGRIPGSALCDIDFGVVRQGDELSGILADTIELNVYSSTLAFPLIPRVDFAITGADANLFGLPDFQPTEPFDDLIDVSFDVSADPGFYEAELSFGTGAVFNLQAVVVPEPSSFSLCLIVLLVFHPRKRNAATQAACL